MQHCSIINFTKEKSALKYGQNAITLHNLAESLS